MAGLNSNRRNNIWKYGLLSMIILTVLMLPGTIVAQDNKTDLQLMITGGFPGTLTPGQAAHIYLTVKNNGDTAVENISFRTDAPVEVPLTFLPDFIAELSPGSSTLVDINLLPAKNSGNRDYNINLIADSVQTRAVTTLYFRVAGGFSYWTWVGLGLGVLVIVGFILVYRRFGKS
jgi:uncharacterized membrane protein